MCGLLFGLRPCGGYSAALCSLGFDSQVKKVLEQFEPFLQFWTTASSWKASHQSWMHDSWEQLNGEVVERDVTNAYKVCVCGAGARW